MTSAYYIVVDAPAGPLLVTSAEEAREWDGRGARVYRVQRLDRVTPLSLACDEEDERGYERRGYERRRGTPPGGGA